MDALEAGLLAQLLDPGGEVGRGEADVGGERAVVDRQDPPEPVC